MKKTTLSLTISEETTLVLNGMELKMLPDGNREYEVEISLTPLPVVEIRPPMPERARPVEASLHATPPDVPEEDFWDDFEEERREEAAPHSAEEEVAQKLEELLEIVSGSEEARMKAAKMLAELLEPEQGDAEEDDEDEPDDGTSVQPVDQGPYVPSWL